MLESILLGVLSNVIYGIGTGIINFSQKDESIQVHIKEAHRRALERWSINSFLIEREESKFNDKFELLKGLLFDFKNDEESIENPDLSLFLDLFKEEILRDNFAWNSFESEYLRFIYRDIQEIKEKLENINIKNEELLNSYLPDYFIKNIDKYKFYINRRLSHYTEKVEKENIYFGRENAEKITLIELIKDKNKKKIVLLGSAGMGKSTELKQTAHRIAELNNGYYPIFYSLNTFTSDKNIEDFLPIEWRNIPQNQLVILLDGLDEIIPEELSKAKRKIIQFSDNNPNLIIIITCRTNLYDLPINSNGTLKGFDAYFIEELLISDVKNHIDTYEDFDSMRFIYEVEDKKMLDLITNPFFLQLIIVTYKSLDYVLSNNRADIFKNYFDSRYAWDKEHYNDTINLKNKKYDAIDSLMKVALTMEIIGKRIIQTDEIYEILTSSENIELISYCTAFKKVEGLNDTWQFEHKYFQEYLSADLLSKQSFEQILSLICIKGFNKVSPNWQNTITLLISILDDTDELKINIINWLIDYDHEVIVRTEREKVSKELRLFVFNKIFDYYKERKIWLNSNKFSESELAYFGQTDECIELTISEAINSENHRRFRISLLKILENFKLKNYQKEEIKGKLFQLLEEIENDTYFQSSIIEVFKNLEINDHESINHLFKLFGNRRYQDIRASMYSLLNNCIFTNDFIDYYLEGIEILKSEDNTDRDSYTLLGEDSNLLDGLKKINTNVSLKKLIAHIIDNGFKYTYHDKSELFQKIVENAVIIYENEDVTIFSSILDLVNNYFSPWDNNKDALIIKTFFEKTNTINQVFCDFLKLYKDRIPSNKDKSMLSFFANENNINLIIDANKKGELEIENLKIIYNDINYINNELAEKLRILVLKEIKYEIADKFVDINAIFKENMQKGFNILFDFDLFKYETIKVFGDKEQITIEDLKHTKYYNYHETYLFNISSVDLIICLLHKNNQISIEYVIKWISNNLNFKKYQINEIYQKLKNNNDIQVSEDQLNFIRTWFESNIEKVDFTKAITYNENGSFSVNNYANIISFLLNRFGFECSKCKLLDMFLFVFNDDRSNKYINFDKLVEKLDKEDVDKRIVENINQYKEKLEYRILMNHINYIFKNELKEGYNVIFDILVNSNIEGYQKESIIRSYFNYNKNYKDIIVRYNKFEFSYKLYILKHLIEKGDKENVKDELITLKTQSDDKEINRLINSYLIKLEDIRGLEFSIEWIKKYKYSPFGQNIQTLNCFKDINVLPYFIKLLELSYDETIKVEHEFDKLWSIVIGGLEHLALYSFDNFHQVINELGKFIVTNKTLLEDVEFLNNPIERIKGLFINNITVKHDIRSANEIIKKLS